MLNDLLLRFNNCNNNNKLFKKVKFKIFKKKKIMGKCVGWILFFIMVIVIFCVFGGYLFIMVSGEWLFIVNMDKIIINEILKVYDCNG